MPGSDDDSGATTSTGDDGSSGATTDDGSVTTSTGDDGSSGTTTDDGSATDAVNDNSSVTTIDGPYEGGDGSVDGGCAGLGCSCIGALYSTYILRTDGVLIWENQPTDPQTIVDASTGTPLMGVVNVQEARFHGCAALSGGSAECWQTNAADGNASGQLGNGTTTANALLYRATPVLTAAALPLANVASIAPGTAGESTSCAVTSDGKLWCWGDLTWIVKGQSRGDRLSQRCGEGRSRTGRI